MTIRQKTFKGPLFVVGMSRSGTTLLREILNRNPEVGIPSSESLFIPYIIHRFRDKPFPLEQKLVQEFRNIIKESSFYNKLRANGLVLQDSEFDHMLKLKSLEETIEALMRFFIASDTKKYGFIWGDKSPNYLLSIALLKSFFPSARFIHIIRDPRDRALSAHKAWGANLYFAAERWHKSIKTARMQGQKSGDDYLEVFYEKFTGAPDKGIEQICKFLDINYDESMLELKSPVEKYHTEIDAETRNTTRIVSDNTKKYIHELNPDQIKRIDEIVFPVAHVLGYSPMHQGTTYVPLAGLQKMTCFLTDRFNAFTYHVRRFGVKTGLRYLRSRSRMLIANKLSGSG